MSMKTEESKIFHEVHKIYLKEIKNNSIIPEWIKLGVSYISLNKVANKKATIFDPRFNPVHWAFNVYAICREIMFSYCWMNAYATFYKMNISQSSQPAHVDFYVSYFADNCVTRIDSCRDKLALMVWAYYCPFNPEKRDEVLDYDKIIERLRYPVKFGLSIESKDGFLEFLEIASGDDFKCIETYRNFKVHRIEPRLEIYGVEEHHGWDYMLPLFDQNSIKLWEDELKKQYKNESYRERIKQSCHINGVLFNKRRIKNSIWSFDQVQKQINSCMTKLFQATGSCFLELLKKPPFKEETKKNI
jgi:hypothetical protein